MMTMFMMMMMVMMMMMMMTTDVKQKTLYHRLTVRHRLHLHKTGKTGD